MREFKFRSWIKKDKRFIYDFLMKSEGSVEEDTNILSQYTGFKDKNGIEIYEGDIVKLGYDGDTIGIAEFGEGHFDSGYYRYTGFYIKYTDEHEEDYEQGEDMHNFYHGKKHYFDEHGSTKHWVVIGNIYENPELLKGE